MIQSKRNQISSSRARWMIQAAAYGDALGARYEGIPLWWGTPRIGRSAQLWRSPGHWTDDTDMSLGILLAMERSRDDDEFVAEVLRHWITWYCKGSKLDMGQGTLGILRKMSRVSDLTVERALCISRQQLGGRKNGGGNGAVMRTAAVALWGDSIEGCWIMAKRICELTHPDPIAMEAAGIWTLLCRQAIEYGQIDPEVPLSFVKNPEFWAVKLHHPQDHRGPRGWAVTTLCQSWSIIRSIIESQPDIEENRVLQAVTLAVRLRSDPDTVAACTGALSGALWGGGASLPDQKLVHGGKWTGERWDLDSIGSLSSRMWKSNGS